METDLQAGADHKYEVYDNKLPEVLYMPKLKMFWDKFLFG